MKDIRIKICITAVCLCGINACNEDAVFKKEQYKKVVALVSNEDYNVFSVVHDLNGEETIGYIAASIGGSNPSAEDVILSLIQDNSLVNIYNTGNFDVAVEKYAKVLPDNKFHIESYRLTIPAGQKTGRTAIRIIPEGLSPDTVYFVPLRINTFTGYEVNPNKADILYKVFVSNYYASTATTTTYNMIARYSRNTEAFVDMPGLVTVHPIAKDKIRLFAGDITFSADIQKIDDSAIIIEVKSDNSINITAYKNLEVTQINGDPDFPNVFSIYNDGFKSYKQFLLHYRYSIGLNTWEWKQELRKELTAEEILEYNKNHKD
ncbi:MAG: DUF1735 domain-containing protein [Tannerellaceae bacterium]|jgi:hypothetical protein|nr:DUF1735 domain-containing protein [Tannerellaceae bacterium]